MTEKEFTKLAKKHLFSLEVPRNAFGGTKLEVFGIEKLYKAMNYARSCGVLCDDCKEIKTDTITLCKDCYLNE